MNTTAVQNDLSAAAAERTLYAGEYTFRTATQIKTGALVFDWLNKGVFISVAGRQPAGVVYETDLVG